jgi:hypothetical protein
MIYMIVFIYLNITKNHHFNNSLYFLKITSIIVLKITSKKKNWDKKNSITLLGHHNIWFIKIEFNQIYATWLTV